MVNTKASGRHRDIVQHKAGPPHKGTLVARSCFLCSSITTITTIPCPNHPPIPAKPPAETQSQPFQNPDIKPSNPHFPNQTHSTPRTQPPPCHRIPDARTPHAHDTPRDQKPARTSASARSVSQAPGTRTLGRISMMMGARGGGARWRWRVRVVVGGRGERWDGG